MRGTTVEVSGHGQIEADYLVLATGTAYPFPAKHMESSSVIAKARIERVHSNLEHSSRVLIVGAGASVSSWPVRSPRPSRRSR